MLLEENRLMFDGTDQAVSKPCVLWQPRSVKWCLRVDSAENSRVVRVRCPNVQIRVVLLSGVSMLA